MNADLLSTLTAAQKHALYDSECKRLLANKHILAHILKHCVAECRTMEIPEIIACIDGTPEIGETGVNPDESHVKSGSRIEGLNTEDSTISEHTIYYDIKFDIVLPKNEEKQNIRLIINLEAQNKFHNGYDLLSRAVYYGSRLISAQYGTVFENEDYGKIQKVYTIWICINAPKNKQNSITEFAFHPNVMVGSANYNAASYDLIRMVMVCLGDGDEAMSELLRLLDVLVSKKETAKRKIEILENEFDIPFTGNMKEGVGNMCNISYGFYEQGIAQGIEQGIEQGIVKGKTLGALQSTVENIKALMESLNLSFEEAVRILKIPAEQAEIYKTHIQ